jgi:GDP-mannose 6-dehydrogenase
MSKSISVFGLGYVGCVTAACLSEKGNSVIGVDLNPAKVAMLEAGQNPILEPQMNELVEQSHRCCRLHATTDALAAVSGTEISFICVGTPSQRSGKLDLSYIERVCTEIGSGVARKDSYHLVVVRSTVLPGTVETVVLPLLEKTSGKRVGEHFGLCMNPEFTREGSAVADFFSPGITVLGANHPRDAAILREVYSWIPGRVFETSLRVAELVKYSCNAWHAVKVCFGNEIGRLARELGVDAEVTMEIFCADERLNLSPAYLKPGFAFGGSCLPKDLRAITYRAKELDLNLPLLESLLPSNEEHLERAVELVLHTGKKKIGVLGLSFKAQTDDLRESPQVQLCKRLLGEGCQLRIWDDNVAFGRLIGSNRQYIEEVVPHIGSLLCNTVAQALEDTEVVVVATRGVGKQELMKYLRPEQILIDLVNLEKNLRPNGQSSYEGICW